MSYIHIDERLDVLASLELCAIGPTYTRQTERAWNWVVLSLHSALQGAMVCHLSGTGITDCDICYRVASFLDLKHKYDYSYDHSHIGAPA